MAKPEPEDSPIDDKPMPLLEHLIELRRRLLWSIVAFLIAFVVCYHFSTQIYRFWLGRSPTSCNTRPARTGG